MRSISGMPSVQPPTAGEGALPVKANAKHFWNAFRTAADRR